MRRPTIACLAALGLLAAACTETDLTRPGDRPVFAISDAVHGGGRPGFYFMPPMAVPRPVVAGVFDATLSPVVQVCVLSGPDCATTIVTLSMTSGPVDDRVRLAARDELYVVNWRARLYQLDPQLTYRVVVFVGSTELGFADVDVAASESEFLAIDRSQFVPLLLGRNLPIAFRIEQGLVASIAVVPADTTINAGDVAPYTATATDLHGAVLSGVSFAWASADGAVATVDQAGLATGVAAGSTAITASAGGVSGTAALTVLDPTPQLPDVIAPVLGSAWASGVATDVNDHGIVVGYVHPVVGGAGQRRAFRWNGVDSIEVLPTGGATWCEAWGIGNLGTIVGTCATTGVGSRGVTWTGSAGPVELPTPTALILMSAGRDIYEDATVMRITGSANRNYNYTCSFPPCTGVASNPAIWTSTNGLPPVNPPTHLGWGGNANGASGSGHGINASGHATGQRSVVIQYVCGPQCFNVIDVPHGFRSITSAADLGANYIPPHNTGQSAGLGINAADVVVGWTDAVVSCNSSNVCVRRHLAQIWPASGSRTGIPGVPAVTVTASEANDVNDLGWVVGLYGINAFLWRNDANPAAVLDPLVQGGSARALSVANPVGGIVYAAGSAVNAANQTVPVRWTLIQ